VLFVGRLVYYKGVEYLIKAMKEVDAELLLIGDGKLRAELTALTNEMGLAHKVHFLGEISDEELPEYYHACDVFVLPSISPAEGFGLVQIEAQACGKPVVSTSLPTGVPFVNLHEKTGLIVPPKNSKALAEAINKLLGSSNVRKEYESRALERAQQFRAELMVRRVFQLYEELLDGYRQPS
jgi:rhamnosyl/mannosyltransferase